MPSSSESSSIVAFFWKICGVIVVTCFGFWGVALLKGAIQTSYSSRQPKPAAVASAESSNSLAPAPTPSAEAPTPAAVPAAVPAASQSQDSAAGQTVYNTVCIACHQPTGQGLPGMFPPLAGSDWVSAPKPDRLIRIVLHGLMGPIEINGAPFNTPAPMMPPQGAALSDEQIAQVLTHIRVTWGGQAEPVTKESVAAVREAEKARTAIWTASDLTKIPDR